jgi:tRNA threonylcarbamoyladenosine modification (KEOPS) complex  Pcc1 subunit
VRREKATLGEKQRIFQLEILEGDFMQLRAGVNDMWDKMTHEIKKVAKESWWWNDSVQIKV